MNRIKTRFQFRMNDELTIGFTVIRDRHSHRRISHSIGVDHSMPPPSRRSHGLIRGKPQQAEHQGRARGSNEDGDADEEIKVDEDAPVVKPEILEEYLNRPIDLKTGEARLKQVSAELDVAFSGLKDAIGSLTEAALDVVGSLPTFEGDLDEDDMPEDPVRIALPSFLVASRRVASHYFAACCSVYPQSTDALPCTPCRRVSRIWTH